MTDTDEQAVARAIRDAFPHMVVGSRGPVPWDELGPTDRETWVRMARAAIACIRALARERARTREAMLSDGADHEAAAREVADWYDKTQRSMSEDYAPTVEMIAAALAAERAKALEEAASIVDECNREGPYNAIGAASRIRALRAAGEKP